jgi:hypothetical protein
MNYPVSVSLDVHIILGVSWLMAHLASRDKSSNIQSVSSEIVVGLRPRNPLAFRPRKAVSRPLLPSVQWMFDMCITGVIVTTNISFDAKKAEFLSHDALRPQGVSVQPSAIHLATIEKAAAADT